MQNQQIKYPKTKKGKVIDTYFGTEVADPYRWLEDDLSKETADWVKEQNKVTQKFLHKIPYKEKVKAKFEKIWNYEKKTKPFKEGKYTYYYKNDGLQNQNVLYRKDANGNEQLFLNPNTFSKKGTDALNMIKFSSDGSLAAYAVSEGGSDWKKIFILNTETNTLLEDHIVDVKFSNISWKGNEGFYYSTYKKPKGSKLSVKTDKHFVFYHKIGTKQENDTIVFGENKKQQYRYIFASITSDDNFLILNASNSTGENLYLKDLNKDDDFQLISGDDSSDYYIIDSFENKLYIQTNYKAPNNKLVVVDAKNPNYKNWKDLIPETKNVLDVTKGSGFLFANYMVDVKSKVLQYDYSGKLIGEVQLPFEGSVYDFYAKKNDTEIFFLFTNTITPISIYSFNVKTSKVELYWKPTINFDSSQYETKQVFYNSKDGTKIPMTISNKKGIALNGKNPTIIYGYGGFDISLMPTFNMFKAVWMSLGGVFAVTNLRGGGEYGKEWYDAGTKLKKQNVFDDFIAGASYLISEKYTSSEFLAAEGGSNGGLLVGAVMTQKPNLFKVALPAVGVLDMLRYHTFTAGAGWSHDYGTSEDNKEMFENILAYSPLHNIKEGTAYPATLVTTGDHDDRVVPAHSFKFAAELQAKYQGENPVLIRIETDAGHGMGKPTSKIIEEYTDLISFTLFNMDIKEI